MKCLPRSKISQVHGNVLHDWHAEILAIRGLNRFLTDECAASSTVSPGASAIVRFRNLDERTQDESQPFTIDEDVQIHMYCSEAPCGDASMELTMDAQEDSTPWPLPDHPVSKQTTEDEALELHGRGHFSELGIVRRKPARADAAPTWSKSCSDKLALKQCTSLLSATVALLISPRNAYLASLVLPRSQSNPVGTQRAFSAQGRMATAIEPMSAFEASGYHFRAFEVMETEMEFEWSRRSAQDGETLTPSNISAACTPFRKENIINGVLQGRKQNDPRGASTPSRRAMWCAVVDVAERVDTSLFDRMASWQTYANLKDDADSQSRRIVKTVVRQTALKGWRLNSGDDGFTIAAIT